MDHITTPTKVIFDETPKHPNSTRVIISPCYPGYGATIGNALRRVLLSSLPGAAITAVKIRGVDHEFSAIENVKEDVIEIIQRIKLVRVKSHSSGMEKILLKVKGKKVVTAGDFEKNSQVEIANPDLEIATITHANGVLEIEAVVEQGVGYLSVESQSKDRFDVGVIMIDASFSPILHVGYMVESVRVGKRTDYDKIVLDIETDGAVSVKDAVKQSVAVLIEQFQSVAALLEHSHLQDEVEKIEE